VSTSNTGDQRTFEELMADLESVTEQLAAGDLGIESAVDLYERAVALHQQAAARLEQVRARVDRLTTPDEDFQAAP
jgi:exodeoxyribonuclease VII small subunit